MTSLSLSSSRELIALKPSDAPTVGLRAATSLPFVRGRSGRVTVHVTPRGLTAGGPLSLGVSGCFLGGVVAFGGVLDG